MVIYIISQSYYNNRDRERYGVEYFSSQGYLVIVLSVQDYINPELKKTSKPNYIKDANAYVYYCNNFNQIKYFIRENGRGIAFTYLSDNYQSIRIKRYLQKNKIKIGTVYEGMLPSVNNKKSTLAKIRDKFKILTFKNFINLVFKKIYAKIFDIKYNDFVLTNNYETALENYALAKPLQIINIHAADYELYLNNKKTENIIEGKYIVFIDQNILNHTDFIRTNNKLNISEDKYFKELNNYFEIVEKKMGYKVVIAAHPNANIANYDKIFTNQEIFTNKTIQLVKYSEFVITHYSTAINFAIIYKKPIIFLTNDELKSTFINQYIRKFADVLDQPYINISNFDKDYLLENLEINLDKYNKYKFKYITKNDNEIKNFEYFNNVYLKGIK